MRPIISWEMRKKDDAMTSNIDSLSKTTCFMKEVWMTVFSPCSGSFPKGVLIRRGPEVAGEWALGEEVAVDGKDEFCAVT